MSRVLRFFVASLLLTVASSAHALPANEENKVAARKIALEGLSLFDQGKYFEALECFERAEKMVHAPTMQLMAARSLAKLGRLLEASEKYLSAAQSPLEPNASDAFRQAVLDAAKERSALLARIPSVVITLEAPSGSAVTVKIDGTVVETSEPGQKHPLDTGSHAVEAALGSLVKVTNFDLKEGENREVHFDLRAAPSNALRTAGFVTLSVGLAGLVMGGITSGLGAAKNNELTEKGCSNGFCPAAVTRAELDDYNLLKNLGSAGLVGGGILLVGGATLVLVAPSPSPSPKSGAHVSPWIGIGRLGLRGSF